MNPKRGTAALFLMAAATLAMTAAAGAVGEPPLEIRPLRGIYTHPTEGPIRQPSGLFYDALHGELFICDQASGRIVITDERGIATFSFGSPSLLPSPTSLVVDDEGRVLVINAGDPAVRVFDYDGSPLPDLDLSGVPAVGRPLWPAALALSPEGTLYVLDGANGRVIVRTRGGEVSSWSAPAGRSDLLRAPMDIDLTPEGDLAISDSQGLAVQIFSASGRFLRGWGKHDVGRSEFSHPAGIAVDGQGRLFVADTLRHDVKVFTADGQFLLRFGGLGATPGALLYPVDVASDRQGRVFVSERVGGRVQVFSAGDSLAGEERR